QNTQHASTRNRKHRQPYNRANSRAKFAVPQAITLSLSLYATVEPLILGVRTERSAKETPAEVAKGAKNQENSFSCPYFVRAHLPARPDFDTVTTLCFKRSLR